MGAACSQVRGFVERVEGDTLIVRLSRGEACGTCAAKGSCGVLGQRSELRVTVPATDTFLEGEAVLLEQPLRKGLQAVLIGYFVPFVVLIVALIVGMQVGLGQGGAAVLSLGCITIYFVVLYLLSRRSAARGRDVRVRKLCGVT